MFKSLDYNLLILIALGLVVVHLYFELLGVKSKLKYLENNSNNSNNLINQKLIDNQSNLVEKPLENNLIKFDNVQNTTDIFIPELGEENVEELNLETKEIKYEPEPSQIIQTSQIVENQNELEVQNEDSESEIPIYSNDNESLDELSINVTEKMKIENDESKDNLIENILKTYQNKNDDSESDEDNINDENINEDTDKADENLDKDSLVKLKKIDLEKLAEKYNISVLKNLDGKLKKKTKDEIVSDLVNLN